MLGIVGVQVALGAIIQESYGNGNFRCANFNEGQYTGFAGSQSKIKKENECSISNIYVVAGCWFCKCFPVKKGWIFEKL